ncbi:phospholipase A2 inhibitor-like [Branchiostoma floridae]|uniref:Phospholipase A2 inhibitor-like n=1 Tax=Branchiostoma floridae TaxID=7739 RepID=C3ZQ63_BRAFL|nr:phospholipase A2 inhibitor-like [Branchiostoma floridae]|eukprot:XP_002589431.1 hypothetical protein BRAFLDRAFT_80172 [Branchiostoma floridae]
MAKNMKKALILLLTTLNGAGLTEFCSSSCPTYCWCDNRGLSSVPQHLPTGINILGLQYNVITTLHQTDFCRYSSLTILYLTSNQISVINSRVFQNSTSLTQLDVSSNQLTTLRADMFAGLDNLQRLSLQHNNIHSIEEGTFNSTPQLRYLRLYNSHISAIAAGTFVSLSQLSTLDLYNNQLTSLTAGMFLGLDNLETLYLYNNNIHSIEAGTFPTQQLRNLYLDNNNITTFATGAFVDLPHLNTLDLQYNSMETLSVMAYDILASIPTVDISNNPWQCDYRMCPFKLRMTGSYPFENQIICAGPANLAGKSLLLDVNPNDLICEDITALYSTPSASSSVDHSTNFPLSTTTGEDFSSLSTSPITLLETATSTVSTSPTTSITSIQPSVQTTAHTTTPEDVHSTPGVADGDTVPPACSCSQPVLLSGFTGAAIGTLLTSAVFLVVWWHHRMKNSPTPAPDLTVVYNSADSAATVTTCAPDDVAGGSQPITAHRPDPYDADLGHRLVRPHLPPIEGAAADSSDASNRHDALRRLFIHQQN